MIRFIKKNLFKSKNEILLKGNNSKLLLAKILIKKSVTIIVEKISKDLLK